MADPTHLLNFLVNGQLVFQKKSICTALVEQFLLSSTS